MLHFRMDMPLYLMMFSGSIMLLAVLLLRCLLKKRLPGYVFPILWGLVLIRFLVPFSLSSPLSLKVSSYPSLFQVETSEASALAERFAYETSSGTVENMPVMKADATVTETYTDNPETADYVPKSTDRMTKNITIQNVRETIADDVPVLYESNFAYSLRSAVYLLGIAGTAGILLLQKYRYAKRLKASLLIEHNETVNSILRETDMAHILVFSNDEIASPLICGLLVPHIYLPTRMD